MKLNVDDNTMIYPCGNPPIRAASGRGLYSRRLWPDLYSLTPMLPEWAPVPAAVWTV